MMQPRVSGARGVPGREVGPENPVEGVVVLEWPARPRVEYAKMSGRLVYLQEGRVLGESRH
jgi:hypothetical protein